MAQLIPVAGAALAGYSIATNALANNRLNQLQGGLQVANQVVGFVNQAVATASNIADGVSQVYEQGSQIAEQVSQTVTSIAERIPRPPPGQRLRNNQRGLIQRQITSFYSPRRKQLRISTAPSSYAGYRYLHFRGSSIYRSRFSRKRKFIY